MEFHIRARDRCWIVEQRDFDYLRALGRNLRGARARADLTQEEVARLIDMNPRQYGKLELGQHNSGILSYAKAMQAVRAPIGDLFRDVEGGP